MSTPIETPAADTPTAFATEPSAISIINPDDPPWGVAGAVFVLLSSVIMLTVVPSLALLAYVAYRQEPEILRDFAKSPDPTATFFMIAAVIPAHLMTLGIVWAVVTQFGKRPFWGTLGWSWGQRFGLWQSIGLSLALFIIGGVITKLSGGTETDIDQIIASSKAARYIVAFLAVATAPLVEEVIYRGVLYSAVKRLTGMLWAVVVVSTLFALVHAWQYRNNLGAITAVTMLSFVLTLVRARTGRLLPCFVMHLVFNGIQSVIIILEPLIRQPTHSGNPQPALLILLTHTIGAIF